jgi:hypothetical protein
MRPISLYVTAPPFLLVRRLDEAVPPLGAVVIADLTDHAAAAGELRPLLEVAPWCPLCVLIRTQSDRRRLPRSPRVCAITSLGMNGGSALILAAVRARPEPQPMDFGDWLAERTGRPALSTIGARLFARALQGTRSHQISAVADGSLQALGAWGRQEWEQVARLADLAAHREALGRLLVRDDVASAQAVQLMRTLLDVTEDEFRERAGWEWVLETALRRSRLAEREVSLGVPPRRADLADFTASPPPVKAPTYRPTEVTRHGFGARADRGGPLA